MNRTKEPFYIVAKPIGALCNLNCTYCYYLKKERLYPQNSSKQDFIINDKILEKFIDYYINSQPENYNDIYFIWQGGEPTLLGIHFFEKVITLQEKYRKNNIKIMNFFQTNGKNLNEDFVKFFKDYNFLVGISIDGPEDLHDYYRIDKNGKGSFREVIKSIDILLKLGVEFNTLTTVHRYNANYPDKIYNFLKSIGSTFIQFIPIVEPDVKKVVTDWSVDSKQWGDFISTIFKLWLDDIGKIFIQQFDIILGCYLGIPSSICTFSKECGKGLVIEHNGDIFSCDHFVFPEYYLGNINNNSLSSFAESETQIAFGKNKYLSLPDECLKCKFLSLCYGGCPKDRILKRKTGNLNWLCQGYFNFFKNTDNFFRAMALAIHNNKPAGSYIEYLNKK